MFVNVLEIPSEGLKIDENIRFDSFSLVEEEAIFLEPVKIKIEIHKENEKVFVSGRVSTTLSLTCSRCLSPYPFKIDSYFDLVYYPIEDFLREEEPEKELKEADFESMFYRENIIDIDSLVLEQINLTIPMKPLCSESCKGLCPVCGTNLNEGECGCKVKSEDPRLGKIKLINN
jgi:uncharacterized protein